MDYRLLIGLIGSVLLVAAVALRSQKRKNNFFAIGNVCMFTYALLGYFQGGPIFFLILQMFILLSTLCMLFHVPDAYNTPILAMGGIALIWWSLSIFQDYSTAIFVVGLALLGIGYAMHSGTLRREIALMIGSAIIALFSFLMRDWAFFGLNILFCGLSLVNVVRFHKAGCAGRI
ncbi:hypothetical protein HYT95_00205 [Candidatus Peregrinibacteria bacterium]|nr:hypothetical protein [Candidatus Peregrinibacteria bacterium]